MFPIVNIQQESKYLHWGENISSSCEKMFFKKHIDHSFYCCFDINKDSIHIIE